MRKNSVSQSGKRINDSMSHSGLKGGRVLAIAAALVFGIVAGTAQATDLYWSGNGATQGGNGTWDTSTARWGTTSSSFPSAWNNANNDTAIFGGTVGTVTNGTDITVGGLTFLTPNYAITNKTLTFGVSGTITNAGTATIYSVIAGGSSASITKTGVGTLTLSGTNTYTGDTTISGGTLTIGSLGNLGNGNYAGNISIASNSVLTIGNNGSQTLSGNIANNGTLAFSGPPTQIDVTYVASGDISGSGSVNFNTTSMNNANGTLTLSGNNTYTGKTSFGPGNIVSVITLIVSSFDYITSGTYANHGLGSSLGAPTTVANGTILIGVNGSGSKNNTAALKYIGPGETTDRVLTFAFAQNSSERKVDASGSGLLKFTSPFAYTSGPSAGNTPDITLQGSGLGEVAAGIADLYPGLPVTKAGTGTWTLSGANTFTGPMIVSDGTLVLAGSQCLSDTNRLTIAAGKKVRLNDREKVGFLTLGTTPTVPVMGTWGATGSGATYIRDDYFTGSGVLYVGVDFPATGTSIFVR